MLGAANEQLVHFVGAGVGQIQCCSGLGDGDSGGIIAGVGVERVRGLGDAEGSGIDGGVPGIGVGAAKNQTGCRAALRDAGDICSNRGADGGVAGGGGAGRHVGNAACVIDCTDVEGQCIGSET